MIGFDPLTEAHPIPDSVERNDVTLGVPGRVCYVIYLTLDFEPDVEPYGASEMAGIVAGLWDDGKGGYEKARQGVTVYIGKREEVR